MRRGRSSDGTPDPQWTGRCPFYWADLWSPAPNSVNTREPFSAGWGVSASVRPPAPWWYPLAVDTWSHPLVGGDAALGQSQPEARIGVVNLHGLHQTLERRQGATEVQELKPTVIEQLVTFVSQESAHGDPGELLTCYTNKRVLNYRIELIHTHTPPWTVEGHRSSQRPHPVAVDSP